MECQLKSRKILVFDSRIFSFAVCREKFLSQMRHAAAICPEISCPERRKMIRAPARKEEKGHRSWDGGPWGCCYFNPRPRRARPEELVQTRYYNFIKGFTAGISTRFISGFTFSVFLPFTGFALFAITYSPCNASFCPFAA